MNGNLLKTIIFCIIAVGMVFASRAYSQHDTLYAVGSISFFLLSILYANKYDKNTSEEGNISNSRWMTTINIMLNLSGLVISLWLCFYCGNLFAGVMSIYFGVGCLQGIKKRFSDKE